MQEPLVSVIVPIYKVEEYLNACVQSIKNQTYNNLEIILVDDGSPDKCGSMCDVYAQNDSRIKVIHKKNGGLSDARNAGIDIAKGDYITFVDSDDFVFKEHIERLVDIATKYHSDYVLCECIHCDEKDSIMSVDNYSQNPEKVYVFEGEDKFNAYYVEEKIDTVAWKKLYKRDLFSKIRFPKGKLNEDAFVVLQLLDLAEKVCSTTYKGYAYRINSESIMHSEFIPAKLDSIEAKIIQNKYVEKKHPKFRSYSRAGIIYSCNYCLRSMAKSKYKDQNILNKLHKIYKLYYKDYLKQNNVSGFGKVTAIIAVCNIQLAYAILRVLG